MESLIVTVHVHGCQPFRVGRIVLPFTCAFRYSNENFKIPRHDVTKPGVGFKRNAVEHQLAGSRRLPARPEVKIDDEPTIVTTTGVNCGKSDSKQPFERGAVTRSSLPIVRAASACGPSSATSSRKLEPTPSPFQRTSSCRSGQLLIQQRASGRLDKRSVLPVDGLVHVPVTTTAAMSASATVRNLHPVGTIGGTSPMPLSTASASQRKALQVVVNSSSGKKSSSSSPSSGSSSRAVSNSVMQLKGERLSNYDKRLAASPPTSCRFSQNGRSSFPVSGVTMDNGNIAGDEKSPLPVLSNDFVLHSSFARSVRSPPPQQLSTVTSSPVDSRNGFGVNARVTNKTVGDSSSENGTLRRHTPDYKGSIDGTVISNPVAMMTPPSNSRMNNSNGLKQIKSPSGLQHNSNIGNNDGSSSSVRSPVGICTPLRSSSVSSGTGSSRRLVMKATATETDVEDYAERQGEGKRRTFDDAADGPDWFGSSRYPGSLARNSLSAASSPHPQIIARSGMASPTISPASPTLAARSAWSPTPSPKHSPLQVPPASNSISERSSDCNASGGLLVRPTVSCRAGLVSRLPLNSVTEEDNGE